MTHRYSPVRFAVCCLLLALCLGCGSEEESGSLPSQAKAETLNYEVLSTVEYEGRSAFTSLVSGVLSVQKVPLPSNEVAYGYAFSSEAWSPGTDAVAEIRSPLVPLLRQPETERLVGGDPLLRNFSRVANASLDQMGQSLPLDGEPVVRECRFQCGGFLPESVRYRVRAVTQSIEGEDDAVAVLAVSESFAFPHPGEFEPIRAEHRVLCVMDKAMDQVHFLASSFVAEPTGSIRGKIRAEAVMQRLSGGLPVDLSRLDGTFEEFVAALNLAPETTVSRSSNRGMPGWAMAALAVRDAADVTAGAVIEGRPNFAITATIGAALLIDSGVSAVTTLLNEAGVIDYRWRGIPNWLGQRAGLAAAKGLEAATGRDVNEDSWKKVGGVAGDVAALFLPAKALNTGVTISSTGVKIIKGHSLAGKTLRISKHGIELVRKGQNWRHAETVGRELLGLKKTVDATLAVITAAGVVDGIENGREAGDGPTAAKKAGGNYGYAKSTLSRFQKILGSSDWSAASPERNPQGMLEAVHKKTGLTFVLIPPGTFQMVLTRGGRPDAETTPVTIREPFLLCRTECTQEAFTRGGMRSPSRSRGANRPVARVTWGNCDAWCRRNGLRLPREWEWELACRAGSSTIWCFGDDESLLTQYAVYFDNSGSRTHPVGGKKPNAWGLMNMHGNVAELCDDWYARFVGGSESTEEMKSQGRVVRGGCWGSPADCACSFTRLSAYPEDRDDQTGFRPAASLPR